MNFVDSANLANYFLQQNLAEKILKNPIKAEIIFINSCAVTKNAVRKTFSEISKFLKTNKKIIVFGCGAKIFYEEFKKKFPQINIFREISEIKNFFKLKDKIKKNPKKIFNNFKTRFSIAIQNGCDENCSFCISKIARGKSKSFSTEKILQQIFLAQENNFKEIILTGINLGSWNFEKKKFSDLLEIILKKTSIPRIRLSSIYPQFLDNKFWKIFSNPRICDYLHLSVQSGSKKILQAMNRNYDPKKILKISATAKKIRPNVAICGDFIIGFPGENEKNFLQTSQLIEKIKFAKLHVFPFSPRPKTPAQNFPQQIPQQEKKHRAEYLQKIGKKLRTEFLQNQIGKKLEVLVENKNTGWSKNYCQIFIPDSKENQVIEIKITKKNLPELIKM